MPKRIVMTEKEGREIYLSNPICLTHLDRAVATDAVGNALTYSGSSFSTGKFDNALSSGIATVNVPNANMYGKDFTIACWYSKINLASENSIGVRVNCTSDWSEFAQIGFNLYKSSQYFFSLLLANSSLNKWVSIEALRDIPSGDDGIFHFIAITYRSNVNQFNVYLDGILKQTATSPLYYNGNQGRISIRSMGAVLDEVAIVEGILWESDFTPPTKPFKIKK
ncbi:Concanavalin A-like lectin/glucanases superfamily protein [Parabacteroides chinchillae]|uniref:Concanavalin A-like lectin/glucanases superfamily protein n=3 Tax=Parabacteroides TaxID=375288 RepID=A0A8G2BWC7_9BACT|nr:Concanavalin A-like lectin/glucanases superfamily protein [Parabacteroides chinchillae]